MKNKNRRFLIYAGTILQIVYLAVFLILQEKSVDYAALIGMIRGISGGVYFSVYNIWEAEGITPDKRLNFVGGYNIGKGIICIAFPVISGWMISKFGYESGFISIIIISIVCLILSACYKDNVVTSAETKKFNIKKYLLILKKEKKIKWILLVEFFDGFTYSDGAFAMLILLYTIKVFNTSFSMGLITTIVNLLTILLGFFLKTLFRKKADYSTKPAYILLFLMVAAFILMICSPSPVTIPLFMLTKELHGSIMSAEEATGYNNLLNKSEHLKGFTEEYILANEFCLVVSRISGFILLILYAATESIIIPSIFIIFTILLTICMNKLYVETF